MAVNGDMTGDKVTEDGLTEFQQFMQKEGLSDRLWHFTKLVIGEIVKLGLEPKRIDFHEVCGSDLIFGGLKSGYEFTDGEYMSIYEKDGLFAYQFGKLVNGLSVESPAPNSSSLYYDSTPRSAEKFAIAYRTEFSVK